MLGRAYYTSVSLVLVVAIITIAACGEETPATPTLAPRPTPTPTPQPTPTPLPVIYEDTIVIDPGAVIFVPISAQELNRIMGELTIEGGSGNDINFRIVDPFGNTIQDVGRISNQRSFAFVASVVGNYRLEFDNSFSIFSNKVVTYSVIVHWR